MNSRKLFLTLASLWAVLLISSHDIAPVGSFQRALVVHDAKKVSTEFQVLVAGVQSLDSETRKWADEHGIIIQFLSTRAVEADGKPAEIVKRFEPYNPPELLLLNKDGSRCIKRMPCPMSPQQFAKELGKN